MTWYFNTELTERLDRDFWIPHKGWSTLTIHINGEWTEITREELSFQQPSEDDRFGEEWEE